MLIEIWKRVGNYLVVQWLGKHAFTAESMDLIPGRETKILQATRPKQKKKKNVEKSKTFPLHIERNIVDRR